MGVVPLRVPLSPNPRRFNGLCVPSPEATKTGTERQMRVSTVDFRGSLRARRSRALPAVLAL
jgi:hypothetical protein